MNKRPRTGGRVKYLGTCVICFALESSRWYRQENKKDAICRSCYAKERLKNPEVRETRIRQRESWGNKNRHKAAATIARGKKETFTLSKEEYDKLDTENCFYCGISFQTTGIGLDRVDNSRGYEFDNVVRCCRQCNVAKNRYSLAEFKHWIKQVYDNLNK